jgi:hypothetical protein
MKFGQFKTRKRGHMEGSEPVKHSCVLCGTDARFACSKCKGVFYCGTDCQRAHWPHHRIPCCGVNLFDERSFHDAVASDIRAYLSSMSSRVEETSVLFAVYTCMQQDVALESLSKRLHPLDRLFVMCNPGHASHVASLIGLSRVVGQWRLPGQPSMETLLLPRAEFDRAQRKWSIDNYAVLANQWARDTGFLQNGDRVVSVSEANLWNLENVFASPKWSNAHFRGGNYCAWGDEAFLLAYSAGTRKTAEQLRDALGLARIIPIESPGPLHADLEVAWVSKHVMLVNGGKGSISASLRDHFPRVRTETLPFRGHVTTSVGVRDVGLLEDQRDKFVPFFNYAQSVITRHAVYVPEYDGDDAGLKDALKVYHAAVGDSKPVITVRVGDLPANGGSLHCLTTQLHGKVAYEFLAKQLLRFVS